MTPILQTLIPLVTSYGTHKAVQFLEGAEELALPDDDLTSFLARRDVEWDQLETADQDSLRDAYLEAIKRECARRLTPSDPASLFSRMEAALRAAGPELDHLHKRGQPSHSFSHLETLTLGIGDLIAELNRIPTASALPVSSPSAASGVIPAPSRVSKSTAKTLFLDWWNTYQLDKLAGYGPEEKEDHMCEAFTGGFLASREHVAVLQSQVDNHDATLEQVKACHRSQVNLLREKLKDCESALAKADAAISQCHARMDSEKAASSPVPAHLVPDAVKVAQEGSVCEVEPLGEVATTKDGEQVCFVMDGRHCAIDSVHGKNWILFTQGTRGGTFDRHKLPSLIAHLTAWLVTGSFDLKGLTPSPPSSEDKEPGISIGYLEPVQYELIKELCRSFEILGAPIGMLAALGSWGDTLTDEEVLELLQAENTQASTTPQKGGQGV